MAMRSEPAYRHGAAPRVGVLLVNLGTPDAPTPAALRRYLAEFLGDPRVVEIPRPLWWLLLHGLILRVRPARSARKYAGIWTPEGSPLARPGADGMARNAAVVLGNVGGRRHLPVLRACAATHRSAVVREAAAWAVAKIESGEG